jgi:hypothetical protein
VTALDSELVQDLGMPTPANSARTEQSIKKWNLYYKTKYFKMKPQILHHFLLITGKMPVNQGIYSI